MWELKVDYDKNVPTEVCESWRSKLKLLHIVISQTITSLQIHGFADASESAYAGTDSDDNVYVSLVTSKTSNQETDHTALCGAHLLYHVRNILVRTCMCGLTVLLSSAGYPVIQDISKLM